MSVAYELDPADVSDLGSPVASPHVQRRRALSLVAPPSAAPVAPPAARPARRPSEAVRIPVLRPLEDPAPLRLTRRGVVVLSVALAAVGLAVLVLGALSARSAGAPSPSNGPAVVTVHAGDTVWSIATQAAPGQDPRVEVAAIHRLNALHGEALVPGQRLRVR